MTPTHPNRHGTSKGPVVFFQAVEKSNADNVKVREIVQKFMDVDGKFTSCNKIFEYYGAEDAERVVVKGAGLPVMEVSVDYMLKKREKVGVIAVHLHRRGARSTSLQLSRRRS